MRVPILLATCLLLPSFGSAQNLVKNGDFESAQLKPWTSFGSTVWSFDTNGTGVSRSCASTPNLGRVYWVSQPVVIAPIRYELTLDVAVDAPANWPAPLLPTVRVKLGLITITSHMFFLAPQMPTRRRLCVQFAIVPTGSMPLTIEFEYGTSANPPLSIVYVDNVDLRPARNPMFCISGERQLGVWARYDVYGTPNAPFVVFLAPKRLPTSVKIPGVGGDLELDPTFLVTPLFGKLDAYGGFSSPVKIPHIIGLAGARLYWQALEIGSSGPTLGWASLIGVY